MSATADQIADLIKTDVEGTLDGLVTHLVNNFGMSRRQAYSEVIFHATQRKRQADPLWCAPVSSEPYPTKGLQEVVDRVAAGDPMTTGGFQLVVGNKLRGILAHRYLTGSSLKEAKRAVEDAVFLSPPPGLYEAMILMGFEIKRL